MTRRGSKNIVDRRSALAALGAAGAGYLSRHVGGEMPDHSSGDAEGELLGKLGEKSRRRLLRILKEPKFSGQIPGSEVNAVASAEGKPVNALMMDLLPVAQTYSRPPLSNYRVGAVVRGASGSLYLGANLEIAGQALGFAVHAEQASLSRAYMHDESGVVSIAVTAAPCGHCRQFLNELSDGEIQILVAGNPSRRLSSLLPMAFGPKKLGLNHGPLPITEVDLRLERGGSDPLAAAALAAARKSYAPYTKAHSGIALATRDGHIFPGSYIENAAFNPSLSPFQTALVAAIVAGASARAISRVTLVEVEGASISQRSVTEAVLRAVAPAATLRVATATSGA